MSLASRIVDLAARVATEFKTVRSEAAARPVIEVRRFVSGAYEVRGVVPPNAVVLWIVPVTEELPPAGGSYAQPEDFYLGTE